MAIWRREIETEKVCREVSCFLWAGEIADDAGVVFLGGREFFLVWSERVLSSDSKLFSHNLHIITLARHMLTLLLAQALRYQDQRQDRKARKIKMLPAMCSYHATLSSERHCSFLLICK